MRSLKLLKRPKAALNRFGRFQLRPGKSPSTPDPHAPVPNPAAVPPPPMAADPKISGRRGDWRNLGNRRRHGRNNPASIMSPHPEPGPAAPHPMAGNPCIPCPGSCGDNFDQRGRHRTLHDSNLSRRGTGAKASKKPGGGQRQCLGAGCKPEQVAHPSFLRRGRMRLPG